MSSTRVVGAPALSPERGLRLRLWSFHRGMLRVAVPLLAAAGAHCGSRAQGPTDAALRARLVLADGSVARCTLQLFALDGTRLEDRALPASGSLFVPRLEPGIYTLAAHCADRSSRASVLLAPGEVRDLTWVLKPGAAPQNAQTTSDATDLLLLEDLLLADSPSAGVPTLPGAPADMDSLAEQDPDLHDATPAVSADEPTDAAQDAAASSRDEASAGQAASGLSYAGLPLTDNETAVDGLSATQYLRAGPQGSAAGGATTAASFARGAMRTLRSTPRSFSAELSGAGGVRTSLTTLRGGDAIHGGLFAVLRDGAWAATNPSSRVTHFRNGIVTDSLATPGGGSLLLGGSLGGPLRFRLKPPRTPPRAWVFGSIEAQLNRDRLTSTPSTAGFYQLTPMQSALLSTRGVSSTQTIAALNYLDSLTGVLHRDAERVAGFARLDAQVTRRDNLTLTYAGSRLDAPAGAAFGQASQAVVARGLGSIGDRTVIVDTAALHWLHRLTSSLDQELSLQASHELNRDEPRLPLAQEPAIAPGGYAPQVAIAPEGFAYGTPPGLGRAAYPEEFRVEARDALQWRLGQHLLRAGAGWSRIQDRTDVLANGEGTFSYNSGLTSGHAGGLVDWITDFTYNVHAYPNGACPSIYASVHLFCFHSFLQSFGPQETEFVVHLVSGFAQDSWRVRDDLTVTAGVRYDYTLLPLPTRPNFALDAAIATLGRGDAGATATMPEDRNNVGPRLTVAWSPRIHRARAPSFTLRAGYGVFYGRTPGATIAAALNDTALPSSTRRIRIRPSDVTQCPQITTANQGFGFPCAFTAAPPAAVAQTSSALVLSSHFREPAIQRGELTLERALGAHVWLRARYATALATQLPVSVDLNISPSPTLASFVLQGGDGRTGVRDGEVFLVPLYTTRRIAQYGAVTALQSHANATYHAGTLEAGVRAWHGLTARGGYTFSRAIDYGPQQGATPARNSQFDPFQIGYDKSLSVLHLPQRFAGELEYRTRTERGSGWRRAALGGFAASATAVAGSGPPYSYQIYGGGYLSGGSDSLNGSGGATYLPTVGRNTLRLPARSRVDVRLSRDWRLPGGGNLSLFAQATNVGNTNRVTRVETRAFLVGTPAHANSPIPLIFQDAATVASEGVSTLAFGTPLSSTTGLSRERQMELGLRLRF